MKNKNKRHYVQPSNLLFHLHGETFKGPDTSQPEKNQEGLSLNSVAGPEEPMGI